GEKRNGCHEQDRSQPIDHLTLSAVPALLCPAGPAKLRISARGSGLHHRANHPPGTAMHGLLKPRDSGVCSKADRENLVTRCEKTRAESTTPAPFRERA